MATIQKRKGPLGTRYRVLIRRRGRTVSKTFPTRAAAKSWAAETELAIESRRFQDPSALDGVMFSELIDLYIEDRGRTRRPVTKPRYLALEQMRQMLGDYPVGGLDKQTLLAFARKRLDTVRGNTVVHDLALISVILRNAKSLHELPVDLEAVSEARTALRASGVDLRAEERDRTATDEEISRITGDLGQRGDRLLADIVRFAVATGMRLGEIVNLRWADLDEGKRVILIRDRKDPKRKQGNHQRVPLLDGRATGYDALKIIQHQPGGVDRIFPMSKNLASVNFSRATRRVDIEGLRFHDLRHTALTRLAAAGFDIPALSLISGHKTYQMLARYVSLRAEDVVLMGNGNGVGR
jgi:integrase